MPTQPILRTVAERLEKLSWPDIEASLDERGHAKTPRLLGEAECEALVALYPQDEAFRSRIDMARYRFGMGEYKYFRDPLPPLVAALRQAAYPRLAPIANRWMKALGLRERYPAELSGLVELCRRRGQTQPTPLLLRYEAGGYNCLHQDIYGEVAFPLQLACVLSRRGIDYQGGEFLLVEQRPRAQSRGESITLEQGEALIFSTRYRPVRGTRGYYRVGMRHGVSRLHSGIRYTLGVIFHNAR